MSQEDGKPGDPGSGAVDAAASPPADSFGTGPDAARTRQLIADLDAQLESSRRQLAVMWCGLEDAKQRRLTPRAMPPVPPPGPGPGPGEPADVLIVDDDKELLSTLREVLADEGYSVATVPGGPEALAYLREHERPAALVLDLMMPRMSGQQLLQQLVAQDPAWSVPVVVFTAASDAYVSSTGVNEATVVRKPFLSSLLQRLAKTVGRPG